MSAPTVRFLRTVEQTRLLRTEDKRKLAATVYSNIKPFVGTADYHALRRAAHEAQDRRWRLVSAGTGEDDLELAGVKLVEQWLLAQSELVQATTPVAEILAAKRAQAVERFVTDHLSFESGDVIYLSDYIAPEQRVANRSSDQRRAVQGQGLSPAFDKGDALDRAAGTLPALLRRLQRIEARG